MIRRGSSIVAVLLVLSAILVLGLGLLGSRVSQVRAAQDSLQASQAQLLAEAGLADARMKLDKRLSFPPKLVDQDEVIFSYTEDLLDPAGQRVGSYQVIIDRTWEKDPYRLIRVTSEGLVGPIDSPRTRRKITAELDCGASPTEWINWIDEGGL
jgi:hypothetical protein